MSYPVAKLQLRWLTPEEGGRKSGPPPGPVYVPTARFADDPIDHQFSIGLRRLDNSTDSKEWKDTELMLLSPESNPDAVKRLTSGSVLKIHEGRRVVADGKILSVRMIDGKQPSPLREFATSPPPATSANN
jgi:hypothetical protein